MPVFGIPFSCVARPAKPQPEAAAEPVAEPEVEPVVESEAASSDDTNTEATEA